MIYTITSTLPKEHGGRTKSLLHRIQLLSKELHIENTILTTNYNINYPEVYQEFQDKGILEPSTKIENIYDWLSGFRLFHIKKSLFRSTPIYQETPREIEGYTAEVSKKDKDVIRYYKGKEYILYRKYYADSNIVKLEDFMSPISNKKVERRAYNKYGYLHQKTIFNPTTNEKYMETFYDVDGDVYCKKYYTTDHTPSLSMIELINKEGRPYRFFDNEKELFRYYFECKFEENDIVFNDARLLDRPLLFNRKKTKNILVFHNSHLDHSSQNVLESYQLALENNDKVYKYLLLTQHQKEDIKAQFNIQESQFVVIPHFIDENNQEHMSIPKKDFVFLGRFTVQKQVPHLIKAYRAFKDKGYEDRLIIYGMDKENQLPQIKKLIKELNLEDSIDIHGFASDTQKVFAEAKASLLTSIHEGFGLTVMESIRAGCPVVSYDVKYGPREIIDHGKNGYLIEPQNIEAFADAMASIVDHPLTDVHLNKTLFKSTAVENYKLLFQECGVL